MSKAKAIITATCLLALTSLAQLSAAPPTGQNNSASAAVITNIEPDLEAMTLRITGKKFSKDAEFVGQVEIYLAETGITTLAVDSYVRDQTSEGVSYDQLVVSGLPANIADFSGTHLVVLRKGTPNFGRWLTKSATFAVTIGGSGSVTGPEGPQGPAGSIGLQGEQGVAGPQGEQGAKGDTGTAGQDGQDGAQGPAGIEGAQGSTGKSLLSGAGVPDDGIGNDGDTYLDQSTGNLYEKVANFWILAGGNLTGPQGEQGLPGPKGDQGIAGPKGDTGDQGPKGDTGAQGPQGIQGLRGLTGDTGPQGLQGLKGDTGAQGLEGPQGLKGDTGATGLQGEQGIQGETGPEGSAGADGTSVVLLGSVADFASLPDGATQGDLWVTLDTGDGWVSDGVADWTNVGQIQGPEGPEGDQGLAGPVGPAGADGAKGDAGPKGDIGLTGPKGDQGLQGSKGDQGVAGPQGEQGPAGQDGADGVNGDGVASVSIDVGGSLIVTLTDGSVINAGQVKDPPIVQPWQQLGADINGESVFDGSGRSTSISADGSILAIGASSNRGNGSNSGHVRIFEYDGANWQQLGADIDGEAATDYSGCAVSLSADGSTVAIGAYGNDGNGNASGHVRIYEYDGANWQQLGADIDGEASTTSGRAVSLSADGITVAIGAWQDRDNGANSGHTRVYRYDGANWQQLGADINGQSVGDYSGWAVSLSADGNILAIGAKSGHVRVYQYSGSSWQQLGADIDALLTGSQYGWSVSLSADGDIVAVGAPKGRGNEGSGEARIYQFSGSSWQQLGDKISGRGANDLFGSSISLSEDGNRVLIGALRSPYEAPFTSYSRIYQFYGSSWQQLGVDINNQQTTETIGTAITPVSLSADGTTVSIGEINCNSVTGFNSGRVRVYRLNP